ncbi:thiamine diphosphokinase [Desulfobacula toluolica]|uniref:Thiamine diphosphokinase n=1 Tax=Desulfobacula toluolica (strain DSM 7467 / Tol2) TaxID=651182 RepID=K0NEP5_DESTT|nr:thiamine diphosphokinase [Desulfobacula toluolica]CCK79405.1 ThiN: thiamine pyrophosphokinase [Desulfobacula toluolica Tol2]
MKCVIIANGDFEYTNDIARVIADAQMIICADGGAGHLKALNILPHVMIGDFDSVNPNDKQFFKEQNVKILPFPPRKNQTDSELCVSYALEKNATDITLLGVTGTRLDHTLANIFLLKKLARKNILARIINKHNQIYMVTAFIELKGQPGDLLSVIPITEKATGVTLTGLEYPLTNANIEMGSSLGISNCFKQTTATVCIEKGILIVTKSKD